MALHPSRGKGTFLFKGSVHPLSYVRDSFLNITKASPYGPAQALAVAKELVRRAEILNTSWTNPVSSINRLGEGCERKRGIKGNYKGLGLRKWNNRASTG